MKTVDRIKYFALAMFVAMSFTSFIGCNSDDNEDGEFKEEENTGGNSSNNNTTKLTGKINNHDAVDLGLSVKWATCNIGASSQESFGNYYGWGDPTGKKTSSSSNLFNSTNIPKDIKCTKYDIAYNNWGNKWRMPTMKELEELIHHCILSVKTVNNVKGVEFRGENGMAIFLPFAGQRYCDSEKMYGTGEWGYYWSSCRSDKYDSFANNITMSQSFADPTFPFFASDTERLRANGLTVRAVSEYDWDAKSDTNGSSSGGSSSGGSSSSTTYEKPDVAYHDFTAYQTRLKVVYKIWNNDKAKVTSAKIYYGTTSNPTKYVSASVSSALITGNISGLKKGTTYYVKCIATGKGGTTTTSTTKLMTNN